MYGDPIMNFKHVPVDLGYDDLTCETKKSGRKYVDPDGNAYPSVTTVLGHLGKAAIQAWRARVGEAEANRVSRQASTRGTAVHSLLEDYVNNDDSYLTKEFDNSAKELQHKQNIETASSVFDVLRENLTEVWGQELALFSKHLHMAGRVDCVGIWKGKPAIIDYKTSRKTKRKEWITSYFLQTAAYAIMFEERTGQPITQLVIVIAGDEGVQVFEEHRDNWTEELWAAIKEYRRLQLFGH
jgi:CRISPR/Cas system-associated exonuclease Cas4 (RecB family)